MDPIEEIGRHQICEQVGTESDTFGGHLDLTDTAEKQSE